MTTLTLKPKQVVKALLKSLPDRAQEVITKRYGLGKDPKKMTLEAIGKTYNITRERVRQIENYAISNIQKSKEYEAQAPAFKELEGMMSEMGGIIAEEDLLDSVSKDPSTQNHIYFLLVLGRTF